MSEEKIIDKVMMIDQWKVSGDTYTQDELDAIGDLLDLYNKEKEKNKELQNADLTTIHMNGFYDGEKKWKDKIKAKIEEIKKDKNYPKFDDYDDFDTYEKIVFWQVDILEELLEED